MKHLQSKFFYKNTIMESIMLLYLFSFLLASNLENLVPSLPSSEQIAINNSVELETQDQIISEKSAKITVYKLKSTWQDFLRTEQKHTTSVIPERNKSQYLVGFETKEGITNVCIIPCGIDISYHCFCCTRKTIKQKIISNLPTEIIDREVFHWVIPKEKIRAAQGTVELDVNFSKHHIDQIEYVQDDTSACFAAGVCKQNNLLYAKRVLSYAGVIPKTQTLLTIHSNFEEIIKTYIYDPEYNYMIGADYTGSGFCCIS